MNGRSLNSNHWALYGFLWLRKDRCFSLILEWDDSRRAFRGTFDNLGKDQSIGSFWVKRNKVWDRVPNQRSSAEFHRSLVDANLCYLCCIVGVELQRENLSFWAFSDGNHKHSTLVDFVLSIWSMPRCLCTLIVKAAALANVGTNYKRCHLKCRSSRTWTKKEMRGFKIFVHVNFKEEDLEQPNGKFYWLILQVDFIYGWAQVYVGLGWLHAVTNLV